MRRQLENNISMYYAVKGFFTKKLATLAVRALSTRAALHDTLLAQLASLIQITTENNTGYTTQKSDYRDSMQAQTIALAGALQAYATDTQQDELARKTTLKPSYLSNMIGSDALLVCENIQKLGKTHEAALQAYGILPAHISELKTTNEHYFEAHDDPEEKRLEVKLANAEALKKMDEIEENLNILDALMQSVAPRHPMLHAQYQASRRIDDQPTRHKKKAKSITLKSGEQKLLHTAPYRRGRLFTLHNKSKQPILWSLSTSPTEATAPYLTLDAHKTAQQLAHTLAPTGDYLLVKNEGKNEVEVIFGVEG